MALGLIIQRRSYFPPGGWLECSGMGGRNASEYAVEWVFSGMKRKNKVEVLRLLSYGIPQKEISEMLNLSKGQVSKTRAWLMEEDYITESGEITVKGENFLRGN